MALGYAVLLAVTVALARGFLVSPDLMGFATAAGSKAYPGPWDSSPLNEVEQVERARIAKALGLSARDDSLRVDSVRKQLAKNRITMQGLSRMHADLAERELVRAGLVGDDLFALLRVRRKGKVCTRMRMRPLPSLATRPHMHGALSRLCKSLVRLQFSAIAIATTATATTAISTTAIAYVFCSFQPLAKPLIAATTWATKSVPSLGIRAVMGSCVVNAANHLTKFFTTIAAVVKKL